MQARLTLDLSTVSWNGSLTMLGNVVVLILKI
jgi:hypothetical protein